MQNSFATEMESTFVLNRSKIKTFVMIKSFNRRAFKDKNRIDL